MIIECPRRTRAATIEEIERAVDESLLEVLAVGDPTELEGRSGGKFTAKQIGTDHFAILSHQAGMITNDKGEKYTAFAIEKAVRAERNFLLHGHRSSFQSQVQKLDRWPGAIICSFRRKYYAFGFSGLPWKYNEAIVLLAAIKLGYLRLEEAIKIARDQRQTADVNHIFLMVAEHIVQA